MSTVARITPWGSPRYCSENANTWSHSFASSACSIFGR